MLLVKEDKAFFAAREMIGLAESSRRLGIQKDGCAPEDYEAVGRALTPIADGGEAPRATRCSHCGLYLCDGQSCEEASRLRAENEQLRKPSPCSCCAGQGKPLFGGECVCRGEGTYDAEVIGLRLECHQLDKENEHLRAENERLRRALKGEDKEINEAVADAFFDPRNGGLYFAHDGKALRALDVAAILHETGRALGLKAHGE